MFNLFWVPLLAFLICILSIMFLRPLAMTLGILDRPDARKRHVGEVPLVGGLAIAVTLAVCMALFARADPTAIPLLSGLLLLTFVGVLDDVRNITPMTKLVSQIFAAILMTSWGGVYLISLGDLLGHREIILGNWGIPLTLFAVVAVVNAMNMCDGMDGLAGGLALGIFGWYSYVAWMIGDELAQRICLIFVGALFAFLIFNIRNPLRGKKTIFLGDAGSLMLGYGIVWFAVRLTQSGPVTGKEVPPVVMLWIVGFVLFDLLAVVLRRLAKGKNPMIADRSHFHHMLLRLKLKPDIVVWLILCSNFVMGTIGVAGWLFGVPEQFLFLLFIVFMLGHLSVMYRAWRVVRFGRKLLEARRRH